MITLKFFRVVFLVFLIYNHVFAITKMNTFQKYVEHGKLPLSFDMFLNKSLARCAAKCNQNEEECAAINYNAKEKQCELIAPHPTILSEFVTYHDDWNVYNVTNQEWIPCSPPSSHSYKSHIATGSPNVITSPNYPGEYKNFVNVYWLIIKPSKTSRLVLKFRDLAVEYHDRCAYDSVSFYRGRCTYDELFEKVCGNNPPTLEDSSSLYVLVYFSTDIMLVDKGFSLEYFIA